MSERLTATEVLERNKVAMGVDLGILFTKLSDELTWLTWKWHEFIELYGTKKSRLELLNKSAPFFFNMLQRMFWDEALLGLYHLTAPVKSGGKPNLTLRRLPELIDDEEFHESIAGRVDELVAKADFAHDWRHRRIAHRDLSLALGTDVQPLKTATRASVEDCLRQAAELLNVISKRYMNSETSYSLGTTGRGAVNLLYVLRDGIRREDERREMSKRGEYSPEMYNDDLGAV